MSLAQTPQIRASLVANQILTSLTGSATQAKKSLAEGLPAQGNQPAVSAADIQAAIGAENITVINAVVAAAGV